MTARVGHVAVIEPWIKPVRDGPTRLRSERGWIRPTLVRKVLGDGVAGLERKAFGETAVRAKGDRVVIAPATVDFIGDAAKSRIRNHRLRCCGREAERVGGNLIIVNLIAQLATMAAVVGHSQSGSEADVALHRHIPLLDVRIVVMQGGSELEGFGSRYRQGSRECIRERQDRLSVDKRVGVFGHVARFGRPGSADAAARFGLVELPIAAADDRLAVIGRPPCESDARRKVARIVPAKTLVYADLAGGNDGRGGNRCAEGSVDQRFRAVGDHDRAVHYLAINRAGVVRQEVGNIVVMVRVVGVKFPPQAVIDGQPRTYLPVVLNKKGHVIPVAVRIRRRHRSQSGGVWNPQKKSRKRGSNGPAGHRGVVKGVAPHPATGENVGIQPFYVAIVAAKLDGVAALGPGEAVQDLSRAGPRVRCRSATGGSEASNREAGSGRARRRREGKSEPQTGKNLSGCIVITRGRVLPA